MIKITKIDNYQEINKQLLFLINKIPKNPLINEKDNISHTDWNLSTNFKREYAKYFLKIINPYMAKIAIELKSKTCKIDNIWFQQYNKLSSHSWHTHEFAHFTNVYFVELPTKSLATEILDIKKLDLNEGDLLTFPAYIYHRSPINLGNKRKTIISFNCNFQDYLY